jgi:hypothetical protein
VVVTLRHQLLADLAPHGGNAGQVEQDIDTIAERHDLIQRGHLQAGVQRHLAPRGVAAFGHRHQFHAAPAPLQHITQESGSDTTQSDDGDFLIIHGVPSLR